jgi:hypothetical protein
MGGFAAVLLLLSVCILVHNSCMNINYVTVLWFKALDEN